MLTRETENYPQCISIEVTDGGSELPQGTPATSLYTPDEAGIKVNIYQELSSYEIPGPKLTIGSGSGSGSAPAPANTKAPAPTATAVPTKKPACKKRRHARQVKQL